MFYPTFWSKSIGTFWTVDVIRRFSWVKLLHRVSLTFSLTQPQKKKSRRVSSEKRELANLKALPVQFINSPFFVQRVLHCSAIVWRGSTLLKNKICSRFRKHWKQNSYSTYADNCRCWQSVYQSSSAQSQDQLTTRFTRLLFHYRETLGFFYEKF